MVQSRGENVLMNLERLPECLGVHRTDLGSEAEGIYFSGGRAHTDTQEWRWGPIPDYFFFWVLY